MTKFNKDNILDAAKRLFEQQGITKTTMNEIAKEADYSKATIYSYFKSKDEIYHSIVCEYMRLLKDNLDEAVKHSSEFKERYLYICNCLVNFEEKYPFYFKSLIDEISVDENSLVEETLLKETYHTGEEINEIILNLLKNGIEEKALREDLELLPTVFYLWSSLSGIVHMASKKQRYFENIHGIAKNSYLQYCFETLYHSIVS